MNTPTQGTTQDDIKYLVRHIATIRGYNTQDPKVLKRRVLQFLDSSPVSTQSELDEIELELFGFLALLHIGPVSKEVTTLLKVLQNYAERYEWTKTKVLPIFEDNRIVPNIQQAAAAILDMPNLTFKAAV